MLHHLRFIHFQDTQVTQVIQVITLHILVFIRGTLAMYKTRCRCRLMDQ